MERREIEEAESIWNDKKKKELKKRDEKYDKI
jgi:hypothetical protein